MITAVSASSGRRSSLLSSVVLPLPRKPVSTVTGMRSSAAVCVSVIATPFDSGGAPERLGSPEILPGPLQAPAAVFVAGAGLLGELAQRLVDVLRRARRDGDVGHHLAGDFAIVQGTERALQAHRGLDIGFRSLRRKGGLQEGRGIAQLLDGDAQPVQSLAVERGDLVAALFYLVVALIEHGAAEIVEPAWAGRAVGLAERGELADEGIVARPGERRARPLEMGLGQAARDPLHRQGHL